ncbi:unnamed protein product [Adineta steineri]|uniref:Uncharacterized protein n=1 Tax=Adineta steineri TaxID=433720 RepID=A0A815BJN0_9BILA|nr:unnamed protein product [Adineta steineri]
MGCCKSLPNITCDFRLHKIKSSCLTHNEIIQFEALLSEIPDHCRQAIINLPIRQLLNIYQYHIRALDYGLQKEWQLVIAFEQRVIKRLQVLLPTDKDHYIFFNFYNVLSASFLALGALQLAIEGLHIALVILLKHTPTDYKTISMHYYHIANVYKILYDLKTMIQYLTKAIEIARLINDLDQEYIVKLETELQIAIQQQDDNNLPYSTRSELKIEFEEINQDFHHWITAGTFTFNAQRNRLFSNESQSKYWRYYQSEV